MDISSQLIEILMAEKGLSKSELSKRCGVSRQNISTIIRRGTAEPKTVGKLAAGLGVTVAQIVVGHLTTGDSLHLEVSQDST